jgi:hypothetical protein
MEYPKELIDVGNELVTITNSIARLQSSSKGNNTKFLKLLDKKKELIRIMLGMVLELNIEEKLS